MLPPNASFFFFNDTATTEIYTLSLHDALPILSSRSAGGASPLEPGPGAGSAPRGHSASSGRPGAARANWGPTRTGIHCPDVASTERGTPESPPTPATD